MQKMTWIRWTRRLGATVMVGLLISAVTPLWNAVAQEMALDPELQPADAIVVLASGLLADGSLTDDSLRRAVQGIALYQRGLAPRLILSGPRLGIFDESEVRTRLAVEMGVPAEAILQETEVNTTRDEAGRIHELLGDGGPYSILLVTESLHMRRAKLVFEKAGLKVYPAPADDYPRGGQSSGYRLILMRRVLQEAGALIYYRIAGYI